MRLNWFQKPGAEGQSDFEHALVINGPGYYAQKYPDVLEFQELQQGIELLRNLEKDSRLKEVDSSGGMVQ